MAFTKAQLDAYIQALYDDGQLSSSDYQLIINYILSNGEPETDPRDLIQIRRGDRADLPTLAQGELGYTLDTEELFIGGIAGNVKISKIENYYNATDYGAKGDGVTDDTLAFKAAIQKAVQTNGVVIVPPLKDGLQYIITDTLTIDTPIKILGDTTSIGGGSVVKITTNKPLFKANTQCKIYGLVIRGTLNVAYTSQVGIYIDDTNGVSVEDCSFFDCYDNILVNETVFYSQIHRCTFYSCVNAMVRGQGTSASGYAFQISDTEVISSQGKYGFYFENAGSMVFDTVQLSPTLLSVSGVTFKSLATSAGVQQFSNCGFEPSALHAIELIGTELNPIRYVFFDNCYFGSNTHTFYVEHVNDLFINNSYLTGDIAFYVKNKAQNVKLSNVDFQTLSAPITADPAASAISMDIIACNYGGTLPYVYLPFLLPDKIKRLHIVGGTVGINAEPIALYPNTDNVKIDVVGYKYTPFTENVYFGSLDPSGNVTITSDVFGLTTRMISAEGFFHNGNFLPQRLNFVSANATQATFSGGTANAKYRVVIKTMNKDDPNWI